MKAENGVFCINKLNNTSPNVVCLPIVASKRSRASRMKSDQAKVHSGRVKNGARAIQSREK